MKKLSILLSEYVNLYFILGVLVFFPLLFSVFFVYPFADDYYFYFLKSNGSIFNTWIEMYFNYNGRFSASFLQVFNPVNPENMILHRVYLMILILSLSVIFYWILTLILPSTKERFSVFVLLLFIFIYRLPSVSHFFYWFSSVTAYTMSVLIFLILFILYYKNQFSPTLSYKILISILLVINAGFNESAALVIPTILFFLIFFDYFNLKKMKPENILFLMFALIGLLLVLLSPGNFKRESTEMSGHLSNNILNLFIGLYRTFFATISFIFNWLNSPLIPISIIIVSIISKYKSFSLGYSPIQVLLIAFFVVYVAILPSFVIIGGYPWKRIQNVVYFYFLFAWVLFLFSIISKLGKLSINKYVKLMLILFLFFSLKNSNETRNNIGLFYSDLIKNNFFQYSSQMNKRVDVLKNHSIHVVKFKPIHNPPLFIYPGDITFNENDFTNMVLCKYYNKQSVGIKKE